MPGSHPYMGSKPVFENRPELLLASPFSLLVDQAVSVDLNSNRPFDQLWVNNLPPGLSLSSDSKQIVGTPSSVGSFISDIETS